MIKLNRFSFVFKLSLLVMVCFSIPDEGMGPLELHRFFLDNDPFKNTNHLTKRERFNQGIPPNKHNERIFTLTINPTTGQPDVAAKIKTQQFLLNSNKNQQKAGAVPGQSESQPWSSIGPNNQAGRVRAALFDEGDAEKDRVISGGVSGGLWLHEDIDNPVDLPWSRIQGVPGNLAVSNIIQDPGNFDIMYVGTGESYTSGDVTGNGIYKSSDGGTNWEQVVGSSSGIVTSTLNSSNWFINGYFYINDLAIFDHDNDPTTTNWIYAALGMSNHRHMPNTYLDFFNYGLIYSTDEGLTWNEIPINEAGTSKPEHINDIEVQKLSNRIWLSTTYGNGTDGGKFYFSDDGTTFTETSSTWSPTVDLSMFGRVEIEPSEINSATHYILADVDSEAELYKTTDNFATINKISEPDDVDTGIPTNDFARTQAFYDLEIEVDPDDDNIVYVGGIDWHRSSDGGQNWTQITKWSDNNLLSSLNVSKIHADQHGLYFRPGNSDQAVVVNDGGVAFVSFLSAASNNSNAFNEIEENFITSQFYTVAQTPSDFAGDDLVFGGTQDNGTYKITNPGQNKTAGVGIYPGGDGAATFFDQVGGEYAIANYTYNDAIIVHNYNGSGQFLNYDDLSISLSIPANEGDFINKAALDSNLDIYYANSSIGSTYKIRRINLNGTRSTSEITGLLAWPTAMEVSPHSVLSTNLYVGLIDGQILKITNADNAGATIDVLGQFAGSVSDIHIGETEDDIYVTYYNYGSSIINVFYSEDGGANWTNKEGNDGIGDLPDIPVYTILHNPYEAEEVIIGTELGIWRTDNFTDTNPNWESADEGMSDVAVYDMVFRGPTALDNRVVAATYGRGIYVGSFSANTNPPISQTDSITVAEGGTATTTTGGATSVLANDRDPDGDPITSSVVTNPLHYSAFTVDTNTGTFTYTHDGTETTTDTFSYRAFDGAVYGNTVSVTINITPVNDCPIVANPVADRVAQEDAPDEIISLLDVFTDAENNSLSLTVSVTNSSLISTAYNNGTGSLTLDYADNAFGTATVTINVNDGNSCTTTKDEFVVTVNSVNDIPVANPESISVAEGGTATTTTAGDNSLLDNDTDADSMDTITTNVVSMPFNYDTFRVNSTTGTFTYIHNGSETTTDSFSYRVLDGNGGSSQIVTTNITISPVNDCPSVVDPVPDFIAQEDDPDDIIDLTNRFLDPENNTLNITVNNANTALLTETYNPVTQEITLDYIDDQVGTATITINIDDNNGCTSTQDVFVVTVVPQNDAPVGVADTIAVDEGATATTTTAGATSVLANDTDMENDVLDAALLTPPLNHNGMFSLAQNGTFTYEHDGSETTTDSFTYTLSDGVNSLTVTVTINISPQNDCPRVISPIASIIVDEDADDTTDDLSLRFTDDDIRPFPNSLSFSVSPTNNDLAVLSINGAGLLTIDYKDNQTGTVTITVSANDNVDCIVNDVFLLTVDPLNDAPVGVADTITVDEAGTATQTTGGDRSVLTNDTDIDNVNSDLTASIVSIPSFGTLTMQNSGTFIYVHDGSETTTDSFVYKPNDGNIDGNDVTVNITINPINDCPEFGPDLGGEITAFDWNEDNDSAGIYNLGSRLVDPDSSPLTYTVTWTNSSVYGINQISTGNFDFVPVSNAFGSSVATITVDDMEGCVLETTFTVNVYSVNDCPTVDNPIADISVNEDADDYWIDIRNTFSDIESSTLNFSAMSTNNSLIATSLTATSLIIDFLDNQNGSTNVVLTVTDGDPSCTVDDVFSVTIASVNDLPLTVTEEISVVSGGTVSSLNDGITTSLLANDIDADGNPLTANLITPPINGTLTLQTNGTFVYTHNGSSTSTDTFYYAANDGYNNGNTVSVTIYINNPPVAVADTIAVLESGTATKTTDGQSSLLWNDTDADASDVASLTAVKITDPSHGSLTLNSDGTFTYVHNGDDQSSDSFTYSADDGKIVSSPITVSIAVTGTNDTPVAYDDTIIVPLGGTATTLDNGYTSFATNDIDPDGDTLTVSIVSSPSYGTISLNPGGTFSYVQNGTINAGDSFTYKVNDGSLDSNIANVNVYLSCTPCTESIIEAGVNGVSFTYTDCLCKTVRVYVPRGKAYSFCHLDTSINVVSGSYALISSSACN